MLGRCSAAAANNVCSKILCKMLHLSNKALRSFVVMLCAVADLRQTRIWQNRNRQRRILAKVAKTVGHVLRPRAAVNTDHVDRKRLERSQSRSDLGAV